MGDTENYVTRIAVIESDVSNIKTDISEIKVDFKEIFGRVRMLEIGWGKLLGAAAIIGVVAGVVSAIIVNML